MKERIKELEAVRDQLIRSANGLKQIISSNYDTPWGKGMVEGVESGIRWYEIDINLIEQKIEIYKSRQ